ncbi:hypothetical protein VTK56DRAFT_370 [Thermocarpiscus australiensis]
MSCLSFGSGNICQDWGILPHHPRVREYQALNTRTQGTKICRKDEFDVAADRYSLARLPDLGHTERPMHFPMDQLDAETAVELFRTTQATRPASSSTGQPSAQSVRPRPLDPGPDG